MPAPEIVPQDEWEAARRKVLEQEDAVAAARASLAAERRRMPMVRVDKNYGFQRRDGEVGLRDLFGGCRQLLVYRFFFDPEVDGWPDAGCTGCSMFADGVAHLAHLRARDATIVFVSKAPQAKLRAYARRMGWSVPWFTTVDDFSEDFGVSDWFGINVFLRQGDDVFRTYFLGAESPAVQAVGNVWTLLDLLPHGRQEEGEDSPEGYPQDPPTSWYRRHDEYDT